MKGDGSKPIPTRFSVPEIGRMDAAAKSSGLGTRATLVKFCVKMFLDEFEARGSKALPRDWREILESLDGRTIASRADGAEKRQRKNGGSHERQR